MLIIHCCFYSYFTSCSMDGNERANNNAHQTNNDCVCNKSIDTVFNDGCYLRTVKIDTMCVLTYGNGKELKRTRFEHSCGSNNYFSHQIEWKSTDFICISLSCGSSCKYFYFLSLNADTIIYKKDIIAFDKQRDNFAQIVYDTSYHLQLSSLRNAQILYDTVINELGICGTFQACIIKSEFIGNSFTFTYRDAASNTSHHTVIKPGNTRTNSSSN